MFVSSVFTEEPLTAQLVPALYVFGDSTVDGGNHPPQTGSYGIDLNPSSIPKRWTNGETIADFIGNLFVILEINIGLFIPLYVEKPDKLRKRTCSIPLTWVSDS